MKNCHQALADNKKLIIAEFILPEVPGGSDDATKGVVHMDAIMMAHVPGGKERSEKEFEAMATKRDLKVSGRCAVLSILGLWNLPSRPRACTVFQSVLYMYVYDVASLLKLQLDMYNKGRNPMSVLMHPTRYILPKNLLNSVV